MAPTSVDTELMKYLSPGNFRRRDDLEWLIKNCEKIHYHCAVGQGHQKRVRDSRLKNRRIPGDVKKCIFFTQHNDGKHE